MGTVYLAGPMLNGHDWRQYAAIRLRGAGLVVLSPTRFETEAWKLSPRSYTTRDLLDVVRSDVVLVNVLEAIEVTAGTCIEIGWATALHKPVVLVMGSVSPFQHGMVRELASYLVPTLDEGLSTVRQILLDK